MTTGGDFTSSSSPNSVPPLPPAPHPPVHVLLLQPRTRAGPVPRPAFRPGGPHLLAALRRVADAHGLPRVRSGGEGLRARNRTAVKYRVMRAWGRMGCPPVTRGCGALALLRSQRGERRRARAIEGRTDRRMLSGCQAELSQARSDSCASGQRETDPQLYCRVHGSTSGLPNPPPQWLTRRTTPCACLLNLCPYRCALARHRHLYPPQVGTGLKPHVCVDTCDAWHDACKDEFFAFSAHAAAAGVGLEAAGGLRPCAEGAAGGEGPLLCSRLRDVARSGEELCREAGGSCGVRVVSSFPRLCGRQLGHA